ncbi:glutamate racemase [Sedimenticola sp.]|uniref:glutamate racemase n=1 Tax=Sedimenticola sp. TaxID=1940285 RepID=UPI003D12EEA0
MPVSAISPIGILDSGAGGLSVLRHIHALLPAESLLYAADSAHLPYGDKTPAFIRERVNVLAAALVERGAKALVVACNTATAAAVESLRERYTMPVVGMEPAIKPAVLGSRSGVVGILATAAMVGSNRMKDLVQRYAGEREVVIQPCPGLVEQVERHALETPDTAHLLQQYLAPILEKGADTLVLGCTHYPFLRPMIERLAGPKVSVIDTGEAIARRLRSLLDESSLLNPAKDTGQLQFFSTAAGEAQTVLFSVLLEQSVVVEPLTENAIV